MQTVCEKEKSFAERRELTTPPEGQRFFSGQLNLNRTQKLFLVIMYFLREICMLRSLFTREHQRQLEYDCHGSCMQWKWPDWNKVYTTGQLEKDEFGNLTLEGRVAWVSKADFMKMALYYNGTLLLMEDKKKLDEFRQLRQAADDGHLVWGFVGMVQSSDNVHHCHTPPLTSQGTFISVHDDRGTLRSITTICGYEQDLQIWQPAPGIFMPGGGPFRFSGQPRLLNDDCCPPTDFAAIGKLVAFIAAMYWTIPLEDITFEALMLLILQHIPEGLSLNFPKGVKSVIKKLNEFKNNRARIDTNESVKKKHKKA